ncbi:MAG: AraC family transcriptional regulator [Acidobacteria bacterium]|nr:AraC family transcriptional regulator [Acidobacteriota bacterium]
MNVRQERAALCFLFDGSLSESIDGERIDARCGETIFHPRGSRVERLQTQGCLRLTTVELDRWRERDLAALIPDLRRPRHLTAGALGELPRRLAAELERDDPPSRLKMEGLILELLAETARLPDLRSDPGPPWLRQATRIMDESFARLGVGDVATAVGIDPIHMAREFRRYQGCTPGEYLRRLRIDQAARLLAETDLPLADVAAASGFYDQSHLSRAFKSTIGQTPSGYRSLATARIAG